jgi:hypothetical protein
MSFNESDVPQNIEGSVSTDQGVPFSPESSPVASPSTQDLAPSNLSGNAFDAALGSLPVAPKEDAPAEGVVETPEGESNPETPPQDASIELDYSFASELGLQHVEFDRDDPLVQLLDGISKDVGLNQEQVEKLVSGHLQAFDAKIGELVASLSQQQEALASQTLETLKSEWGVDAYEQKMPRVAQLLKSTFSDEALGVLRSSSDLGSSVALIKGFAEIADRFGESAFVTGNFSTVTDAYTYESSEAFMREHEAILTNPNHDEYKAYNARYEELIKAKSFVA